MYDPVTIMLGPSDPRMSTYPLMMTILPTVFFSTIYLIFVKVIGPSWMKNKEPYNLRRFMLVYNIFLVGLNGWIALNLLTIGWLTTYSWSCEPLDTSNHPVALKTVYVSWIYYITKLIEYLDTVIFVLRKKYSQINFLHVYHHTSVPVFVWLAVSYGPGGYNTFFPLMNSITHVIMYLYYGLTALGPKMQKNLWWKKYLTSIQIAQFSFVILYYIQLLLFAPKSCEVSSTLVSISLVNAIMYFGLFFHFYLNSYKQTSGLREDQSANSAPKKEI